jgi:Tfp pilus assembly protein PilV
MNSYHKKYKGFTVVEAMAAMVILFIAATAVVLPFTSSASIQQESAHRTLASRLAADQLEQVLATDYDSIIATYDGYTESTGQVKDSQGVIFTDPMYQFFGRQVTCTNATVAGVDLIWVSVTVYYNGTEVITLGTLVGPA